MPIHALLLAGLVSFVPDLEDRFTDHAVNFFPFFHIHRQAFIPLQETTLFRRVDRLRSNLDPRNTRCRFVLRSYHRQEAESRMHAHLSNIHLIYIYYEQYRSPLPSSFDSAYSVLFKIPVSRSRNPPILRICRDTVLRQKGGGKGRKTEKTIST